MTYSETVPLGGASLLRALADNWWLLLLRGIAAIAFGVLAFIWPGITLLTLTLLWGAYAIVDGGFAFWAAIADRGGDTASRWWFALFGAVSVVAGVLTFVWPGATALALLAVIAAWAIIGGILQIYGAIQLRKEIDGEWLMILSGLFSIAFGVILFMQPDAGALAVVWIIGWYTILAGILTSVLAFRLKTYKAA
jgi:uncharacterized membrane protein HdeD (DUF308 family)